jgi:hypothetical protein
MLVIRAQRPHLLPSIPLLLAGTPLVVVAGFATAQYAPTVVFVSVALVLVGRLLVAHAAARAAERRPSAIGLMVDVVLADALLLAAFVRALGRRRVVWRQRELRVGAGGLIEEAPGEAVERRACPCVDA